MIFSKLKNKFLKVKRKCFPNGNRSSIISPLNFFKTFEVIHFRKYRALYITYFTLVFIFLIIEFDKSYSAYYYVDYFFGHIDKSCQLHNYQVESIDGDNTNKCVSDEFALNVFSSVFVDLLFFGILGVLGIILAERKPEDHELRDRINFVANAQGVSKKAKDFLIHSIRPCLVYNTKFRTKIIIKSYSKENHSIYLNVTHQCTMANMCKDVPYKPINSPFFIDSRCATNGDYGMVTKLVINGSEGLKNRDFIDGAPVRIQSKNDKNNNSFEKHYEYSIPKNGQVETIFSYCHWVDLSNEINNDNHWYYIRSARFTDNFDLQIESEIEDFIDKDIYIKFPDQKFINDNELSSIIRITPLKKLNDDDDDDEEEEEENTQLKGIHLQPNQRIKIFFKKKIFFPEN